MMLPDGTSFEQLASSIRNDFPEASGIWPYLQWSDDRKVSRVPAEAAIAIFLNDCSAEDAAAAAARLTPQGEGGRAVTTPATPERYGRILRLYVEATEDR